MTTSTSKESLIRDAQHLFEARGHDEADRQAPTIVREAGGIRVTDVEGQSFLDGLSGIWTVNIGHGNRAVVEAMTEQLQRFSFSWPEGTLSEPAIRLGHLLAEITPPELTTVLLVNSGSEATEATLKLARQYWLQTGHPRKSQDPGPVPVLAWLDDGRPEHGRHHTLEGTLRTLSGGMPPRAPALLLPLPLRPDPSGLRPGLRAGHRKCDPVGRSRDSWQLSSWTRSWSQPASWCHPRGTSRWYVRSASAPVMLLIFDEVITGFGRTGEMFAMDTFGVVPDIVALAKGMSSGYAPLAGIVAAERVAGEFWGEGRAFHHGHTFGGNPVSATAGVANITQILEGGLIDNARRVGAYLQQQGQVLRDQPIVGDVRGVGLILGTELVADRRQPGALPGRGEAGSQSPGCGKTARACYCAPAPIG